MSSALPIPPKFDQLLIRSGFPRKNAERVGTAGTVMDIESRKIPSHEVTYARLRDMILFGKLEPGAAVTIQGLVADLEAGMTPVREAIRRLCAEGALEAQGNRRVCVPIMSMA